MRGFMRCQMCGMVFNNKSGICPRCRTDVISLQSKNKILYKELFKLGNYSINMLQLYCLVAINAVIGIIIANFFTYFNVDKTLWGIPALVSLVDGYCLLSLFAASRRNFLKRLRRFVFFLQSAALLFQIFVFDNLIVSDYFMSAVTLLGYIAILIAIAVTKGKLSQKYVTLVVFSVLGLIPFILVLCGYTSGHEAAYGVSLSVFVLSIFIFLNLLFFSFLKLKYNVGGLLE